MRQQVTTHGNGPSTVRWAVPLLAALAASALLAGCAQQVDGQAQIKAACAARGLTPGTLDYDACLHPSEAKTLMEGEAAWQQMDHIEE